MTAEETVYDFMRAANALADVRKYDQALQMVGRVLAVDPGNGSAHLFAARMLLQLNRPTDALHEARIAISVQPNWSEAHRLLSLASLRATKGKPSPLAVQAATEAVRLSPTHAAPYVALAEAWASVKDYPNADAAMRKALTLSPADPAIWVSASHVAIQAKHWKATESAAVRALALDPDNHAAMNNLGVALNRRGYWPVGAVAFLDAAQIDPRSPVARKNVEGIGFRYMATIVPLFLLPLLIIPPLFVAVRLSISGWLMKRPARLRPRAQRLGLRVATRPRYRRKLEQKVTRMQRRIAANPGSGRWTIAGDKERISSGVFVALAVFLFLLATLPAGLAITGSTPDHLVAGVVCTLLFVGAGLGLIAVVVRRRRYV